MADDVHCIFHHFDLCLLWIVSAIYILLRESFMVHFGAHTPQPLEPQAVRQWPTKRPTNRPTADIYFIYLFFKKRSCLRVWIWFAGEGVDVLLCLGFSLRSLRFGSSTGLWRHCFVSPANGVLCVVGLLGPYGMRIFQNKLL